MRNIILKIIQIICNIFNDRRGEVKSPKQNQSFHEKLQDKEVKSKIDFCGHRFLTDTLIVCGVRYPVISAFPTSEHQDGIESVADKLKYLILGAKE